MTEVRLHGNEIIVTVFTEGEVPQVVCTVETVNEIGVCVKLHSGDTKLPGSVLEDSVSHAAITHLIYETGVVLAKIIVLDFSAIENHKSYEILELL